MNERALDIGDACRAVLREVSALPTELVALADALGRVLAEDVRSPLALPPWDNASMDGYAVQSGDVRGASAAEPRALRVIGTIAAGGTLQLRVGPGEAVRIMTGAAVPPGADSVVRVEDTDGGVTTVRCTNDRDCQRNVRPRGEDLGKGEVAVARGTQVGPAHLGVLASVGGREVPVHRRARVAVLASGDELVDIDRFDEVLAGRRIVTSNSYSVIGAVCEAGAEPIPLGVVGDDPQALRERLQGVDCDLLITTGGVSVGAFDYTRPVLAELGLDPRFWRVRIRPGAPVGFGLLGGIPWLGLPGNPVSTLVTFELLARPAIRRMQGHALPYRRPRRVRLAEDMSIAAPLVHFLRATLVVEDGALVARLTGPQGSGLLTSMARADALLIVPPERTRLTAGETLDALVLRDDSAYAGEPPVQ